MKTMLIAACMAAVLCLCPASPAGAGRDLPAQPRPGDVPPDALGNDRDGNPVTVSQHRGKVVIVTFWASWCGPCRRELPMLGKVQAVVGREHLEIIAVNFKEDRRDFNAVVRANRDIPLKFIRDSHGRTSDTYGVTTLPNMFIIGVDGKVAYVHRGYSEDMIDGFIQEMLGLLPPEALAKPAYSYIPLR
jgi:thiol-disulfide isomerase/thioredoxin